MVHIHPRRQLDRYDIRYELVDPKLSSIAKLLIIANATSVYWFGLFSAGAGEYSFCLDCSEDDITKDNLSVVHWVDGHRENSDNSSQLIYSFTNLTSKGGDKHVLRIRNQIDQRFNGPGFLSFDSLVVTTTQGILTTVHKS